MNTPGKRDSVSVPFDLDQIRNGQIPDGTHRWVVGLVYEGHDPGANLSHLSAKQDGVFAIQPVVCLWCTQRYRTASDPGPVCTYGGSST